MSRHFEPVPSREATTAQQLSALLAICRTLEPWLLEPVVDAGQEAPELDGGVVAAAAATFIKTCDSLDRILDDSSRWDLKKSNELYDAIVESQKCQQSLLKAQTISAAEVQRPSVQIRPTVMVFQGGYLAFWGDPYTAGACIYGKGTTPAAALQDFDAAFHRAPQDQVMLIFEAQQQPPTNNTEKTQPTEPAKRKHKPKK